MTISDIEKRERMKQTIPEARDLEAVKGY